MWLEYITFFMAAAGAIAGALGVVLIRSPFYSVLMLVVHLFALATLFLLLNAEFIAAAQIVVGANSPFLFGRELWRESRPPLFQQSIDTRPPELRAVAHWTQNAWQPACADLPSLRCAVGQIAEGGTW